MRTTAQTPEFEASDRSLISKKDLKPVNNLKTVFREIRDYFAGNVTGISRDEKIAQNIMRILFCKIYDEKKKSGDELTDISNRPNETLGDFSRRIRNVFNQVRAEYSDIFDDDENIEIQAQDLSYIISRLENYSLIRADRDIIADAFEELIGTSFRGGAGQFFTPRNIVRMMIDILGPRSDERIIDPACGSGGFLAHILQFLLTDRNDGYFITGIEKDRFLSKLSKIYLTLLGESDYHIFCENSLETPKKWNKKTREYISLGSFDLILTNPPFGARIPVVGSSLLKQYELGYHWSKNNGKWRPDNRLRQKQPPQILFIERVIQLLRQGGRAGIVLPEGIFGNPSDRYIWEYIRKYASVTGIVSLSQETFQPSTHTKTSVLFLEKKRISRKAVFMAIANAVGHDKNGKETYKIRKDGSYILDENNRKISDDDTPAIARNFGKFLDNRLEKEDHLGFVIQAEDLTENIFIPEFYNPEIRQQLLGLEKSGRYRLTTVEELVRQDILEIKRGNEIGSRHYGTGNIPFIRTTDIVNWEIKINPVKAVSEEIYNRYRVLQDVRENDVLFVNDGTFLIGRSAVVTNLDVKCVIQSHLRKIRVLKTDEMDPFYFFYLLNSNIIQRQIRTKIFVQATLSTLGNRVSELVLPVHTDEKEMRKITEEIRSIIREKALLRERSMKLIGKSV